MNQTNNEIHSCSQSSYKTLSNEELLRKAQATAKNERVIQAEVIKILAEVDRRRLHTFLGYRSLFDFCVKELRYSESSAWRRVSAMRLLKDVPGTEEKLITGELTLKTITSVQTFLSHEQRSFKKNFSIEQKKQILQSIENKTSRETEVLLASLSPIPASPYEKERQLNSSDVEIRFVADLPLLGKLHRLKDLNSHRDPTRSYRGLFQWLSDLGLKTSDPLTKPSKAASRPRTELQNPTETALAKTKSNRYISNNLRIEIWKRDEGKCSYIEPKSGRRCGATSFIEIDHIVPHALGGETTLENLRLYCRTHNLEAARKTYGEQKIQSEIRARQRQAHSATDPI